MKQIWTGKAVQVAARYGDNAPVATACCNACRTCVTTNLIAFATALAGATGMKAARLVRRRSSANLS